MSDHTAMGLRTAIKALKDVVGPAVDPANPLAGEQLRMVCAYLALVVQQLPYRTDRIRFELHQSMQLGNALAPLAARLSKEAAQALDSALARARTLNGAADATERDIESTTSALNAAIGALVRTAGVADDDIRRRIERAVVANSKSWLDVQRAWFQPLGFESKAEQISSIAEALAAARKPTTESQRT